MTRPWNGKLATDIRDAEPDWTPYTQPIAPEGAPNVLMVVWDDVGYGAMDVFGGPIETPAMRRIADAGVRFSNFHTTALCSPTRSSLLTGRNATSNGMACIAEATTGFPGSNGRIPFENGLMSEVLGERGWNTYCVGKWHLTPEEETDLSSWRKRWPLGRGFERFYGFLGGETSQWYPDLVYDNHPVEPPATPEDGYHLSNDLVDKAISFIADSTTVAPEKPWFMYFAPGCAHAPHHVFEEWVHKYEGRFDEGYEEIRAGILERQLEMGLLPEGTELSEINPHGGADFVGPQGKPWPALDVVLPWDELDDEARKLFVRMAEVFAGFVSHTDDQIGRLLDYLEATDQLDNTIIVAVSDNGSSAEGGPSGSFNENKFFNGIPDTIEANLEHIDEWGSPLSYNHYCSGWAWAFDTPMPYWKRFAGYEGGTADLCLMSWPAGTATRGEVRGQYLHAVDVVPTIYELLGIEPPEQINGFTQSPIEGQSMAAAITDPEAPGRNEQFYSMLGQRAMYMDGWLATAVHPTLSGWSGFEEDIWELYNLAEDRSQRINLAAEHPDILRRLVDRWWHDAGVFKALPVDDRGPAEVLGSPRPQPSADRSRYLYYPRVSAVPESVAANIRGRSFTIAAGLDVPAGGDSPTGVLFSQGTLLGGHVLYLADGEVVYTYNWLGEDIQRIRAAVSLTPGRHILSAEFSVDGRDDESPSPVGPVTLRCDDTVLATSRIRTQPGKFGLGTGLCVGRSIAPCPDPELAAPAELRGAALDRVAVDVSGEAFIDHEAEVAAYLAHD
ncbi:MAG: arylsulfatase [Microthrixaceae bacterium]|nr:arylsulfatase [Microthrixaceae bacterium]